VLFRSATSNGQVIAVSRDKKTVTVRFREELARLIEMLSASDRHYVRCIKPNEKQSSELFITEKVFTQLQCNGVFETVAIRKAGFSMRLPFERFFDKYWALLGHRSSEGIEDLLTRTITDTHLWCLGRHKVFLRDAAVDILSTALTKLWEGNAIPIQKHIRRYYIQSVYQRTIGARKMQSYIRKQKAEILLKELRDIYNASTAIQAFVKRLIAYEEFLALKRAYEEKVRCTIIIQRYIRRDKSIRMYTELVRRHQQAEYRASQFKDYYDCTIVSPRKGNPVLPIFQQPWANQYEEDDVIVVVYTPRH